MLLIKLHLIQSMSLSHYNGLKITHEKLSASSKTKLPYITNSQKLPWRPCLCRPKQREGKFFQRGTRHRDVCTENNSTRAYRLQSPKQIPHINNALIISFSCS